MKVIQGGYDQKTIPLLLQEWALPGRSHGGVVFVDHKTIAPSAIGGLVAALLALWRRCHTWNWADRVVFLRPVGDVGFDRSGH